MSGVLLTPPRVCLGALQGVLLVMRRGRLLGPLPLPAGQRLP